MGRLLLVNVREDERRVALIENGVTTELFFEGVQERTLVGTIFKGRVVRVLSGMQAAFVEVGLSRTAFLFVGDVIRPLPRGRDADPGVALADGDGAEAPDEGGPAVRNDGAGRGSAPRYPRIDTLLKAGQELLVQVLKEPMGTKGARVTLNISLPGRYLVYTPFSDQLGVSRRITDPAERERLRAIAEEVRPDHGGVIIRTASEGLDASDFAEDLAFLMDLWTQVERRSHTAEIPSMVHADVDLTLRSVRDLLLGDDDRVVVDGPDEALRIQEFVEHFMPEFKGTVDLYDGVDPLFEHYGVEWEIARAVRRKVWLRSGGYLIIDRTEALTAIDVNSGRYVGRSEFEETVLEVNLEALKEIAYQLRLRDIGGLIVIDFIDMQDVANRQRVTEGLIAALADDKARTHVLPMSDLGLVEMTRKRVRNSIVQSLQQPCTYCKGTGALRSFRVIADSIFMRLRQHLRGDHGPSVVVTAHPRVTEMLAEDRPEALTALETTHAVEIQIVADPELHLEEFDVV